jgi:hypothetical protein
MSNIDKLSENTAISQAAESASSTVSPTPPLPVLPATEQTSPDKDQPEQFQFGLQAYLGMFVVLAVFLSYLRWFGKDPMDVPRFGGALAVAYAVGGVIGYFSGRFTTAMFWVGIGTVCGMLAVVRCSLFIPADLVVWPAIGGIIGAVAGSVGDEKVFRRMFWPAITAFALVGVYYMALSSYSGYQAANAAPSSSSNNIPPWSVIYSVWFCAAAAGAIWGFFVEGVIRLEKRTHIPRHFLALGLVLLAIAVHWGLANFTRLL